MCHRRPQCLDFRRLLLITWLRSDLLDEAFLGEWQDGLELLSVLRVQSRILESAGIVGGSWTLGYNV